MNAPDLSTEWRGPRGVRAGVCAFLRVALPAHLAGCEAAWGLDPGSLPAPVDDPDPRKDGYVDHEPDALDRWPLVAVTSGPRRARIVDTDDDGSPVFDATYAVRVYSWIRTEGRSAAQNLRDDYGTAVGVLLAAHTRLGSTNLRVDPATLVTDFSGVEKVNGERYVAGSYVAFDLHATETLTDRLAMPGQQPRATVLHVDVTARHRTHDLKD